MPSPRVTPDKPTDIETYQDWLRANLDVRVDNATRTQYDTATRKMLEDLKAHIYWRGLAINLRELDARYYQEFEVRLFPTIEPPAPVIKPFDSALDKSYRFNVSQNDRWPEPPSGGWYVPSNWLERLNDIVRCRFDVSYLDGVNKLATDLLEKAQSLHLQAAKEMKATEEGYYAAHVSAQLPSEVPTPTWDTKQITFTLEIQIRTQIQGVMASLTHPRYSAQRSSLEAAPTQGWQWNYESIEFRTNYLAHSLHYMEGLIMLIREEATNV